jgi:cytochrome bd-type quinol oxidase subunit 2
MSSAVFKWLMPEIEQDTQELFRDFLFVTAVCLIVAVVLVVMGAVLSSWTFSGIALRDRLELISQQASNVLTAGFILAAVIALFQVTPERAPRYRAVTIAALIVGGIFALLALYSIGDVLTRHVSSNDSQGSLSLGFSQGASLRARLGAVLPQVGALLLELLAMFGANRIGNFFSGSRVISDDPQDLWEDG